MTAAKRAHRDAGSSASSPPMSLTALLGGAYRLLDSVAMVAPCAGGGHMITPWREAAGTHLKSCARPHSRRTRRLRQRRSDPTDGQRSRGQCRLDVEFPLFFPDE